MSVKIWLGREYCHTRESEMAASVLAELRAKLEPLGEECHILCNFSVPAFSPDGTRHWSTLDMAVLRSSQFVIIELKNYSGALYLSSDKRWFCKTSSGDVEIKGGVEGRTPFRQVCDYREQLSSLLETNAPEFLRADRKHNFHPLRFVSSLVVFPDCDAPGGDTDVFNRNGKMKVVRIANLAEAVVQRAGGNEAQLDDAEKLSLLRRTLRLRPAHIVGNTPVLGAQDKPDGLPVSVPDEYGALATVWNAPDEPAAKVAAFGKLLEFLVNGALRHRFPGTSFSSLAAGVRELLRDKPELIARAERLRVLSLKLRGPEANRPAVDAVDAAEALKLLCILVEHFLHSPPPANLAEICAKTTFRPVRAIAPNLSGRKMFIRMEVVRIDPSVPCFWGTEEGEESGEGRRVFLKDDEMCALLRPGDLIAVIAPRKSADGTLHSSALVLEPDLLISPQKLGNSLPYANAHLHYWLTAMQDDAAKSAKFAPYLLRGNAANAALAAAVTGDATLAPKVILAEFFRENALEFAASIDDAQAKTAWWQEAHTAAVNILALFRKQMPAQFPSDAPWHLEAPFYSAAYGLAARADALRISSDGSSATVFELKSGKWETFADKAKPEHKIQPEFYADLLAFSHGIPRAATTSLLYYSASVPADSRHSAAHGRLFADASNSEKIAGYCAYRNRVVNVARLIREGRMREIFDRLSPDAFKSEREKESFWKNYRVPEIERALAAVQGADAAAKDYFWRFAKFLVEEEFSVRSALSAPLWRRPLAERKELGAVLSSLRCKEVKRDELGRVEEFVFDSSLDPANRISAIRRGDNICLRQNENPEACVAEGVIFAGKISRIGATEVCVKLDQAQDFSLFRTELPFSIEPTPPSFSQHGFRGLWHFIAGDERRRDLVLNREKPQGSPVQGSIVERALAAKDYFLVWGPPGTGKTSHLMRDLVAEAIERGEKVLLLAYTYRATDEICKMLETLKSRRTRLEWMRLGNPLKCSEHSSPRFPTSQYLGASIEEARRKLSTVNAVVSTVSALSPGHAIFRVAKFNLAIVDEASQLLDTHILPLFCAKDPSGAGPLVGRFVFVGDDRQLPAVVQQEREISQIDEETLRTLGFQNCRESFFARARRSLGESNPHFAALRCQYRMHRDIAAFLNRFYAQTLEHGDAPHQTSPLPPPPDDAGDFERHTLATRLAFYPVAENTIPDAKTNEAEAKLCAKIIAAWHDAWKIPPETIGAIVPFRAQIAAIRNAIAAHPSLGEKFADEVCIDTVERFQGSGFDHVIYSTVISAPWQADSIGAVQIGESDDGMDRKLNVAISRAKKQFALVGNPRALRRLRHYNALLSYIREHGGEWSEE